MSYYKVINGELIEAPSVRTSTYTYTEADYQNRQYPTSTGWWWFATLDEARARLISSTALVARVAELEARLNEIQNVNSEQVR